MTRRLEVGKATLAVSFAGAVLSATLNPLIAAPSAHADSCGRYADLGPLFPYAVAQGHENPKYRNPRVMEAVVCLINAERAKKGVARVWSNSAVQNAAHGHSDALVRQKWWISKDTDSHTNPQTQSTARTRIIASGVCAPPPPNFVINLGEINYWGAGAKNTPRAAVDWWMASPPHQKILLDPNLNYVGVWTNWGSPSKTASDFGAATYVVDFAKCAYRYFRRR
jgi:uncharacterized protein YkwD